MVVAYIYYFLALKRGEKEHMGKIKWEKSLVLLCFNELRSFPGSSGLLQQ